MKESREKIRLRSLSEEGRSGEEWEECHELVERRQP
jgi:hypothetical protein